MGEDLTMQEIGRRGGLKTAERHGREHYQAMGRKGGKTMAGRHGHEHFVEIDRKGGQRQRELLAKGRAALEAEEGASEVQ